jgi:hypothetical protein
MSSSHGARAEGRWHDPDRDAVGVRVEEAHGGIRWGSAFVGWLTATGTAVLVTALVSAIGAAGGLASLSGKRQAKLQEVRARPGGGRLVLKACFAPGAGLVWR